MVARPVTLCYHLAIKTRALLVLHSVVLAAMKLLIVFALVLCALQAVQALAIPIDNVLDLGDKEADWAPDEGVEGVDLLALQRKRGELARQFFDLQGVLRAIQNILTAINEQIQKATNDFLNGINKAAQDAQNSASQAVQEWNNRLQEVIDGADAFDSSLKACQAQYRTLEEVAQSLNEDVNQCVQNATASARASLQQLDALGPRAQALFDAAGAAAQECQQQPLLAQPWCLGTKIPALAGQAAGLAAEATRLGAQVTGDLVFKVPLTNAGCVAAAVDARNRESAQVIADVSQCVQDSLAQRGSAAASSVNNK
ncbi:uncharacterized protein LOC113202624 [Frankliniella occidentalis]|uniref:Uncharacterized protein LOC113202624 n=1 Tax=Frankliniella occidentalis TaxID=133901 RepID=A0A6J1RUR0_FRAOC|nr:uncharacterized protein LOC113202624 [Frankliniella occidentalis]